MFPAFFAGLFTLTLLAIAGVVGFALFFGVWYAGVAVLKPERKRFWLLASIPAYGAAFIALLAALWLYTTRPEAVYYNSFGFEPTEAVDSLRSDLSSFADNSVAYLRFRADRETVERIVARGMSPADSIPAKRASHPGWYQPPVEGDGVEFFTAERIVQRHASEREELTYDPTTGEVWFYYRGVD